MKIGFVGLGKMGSQMVTRLINDDHQVVVYDLDTSAVSEMVDKGAESAQDYQDMQAKLPQPAVIWLMIPQQFVTETINKLADTLKPGSIVIDGGNSNFRNTLKNSEALHSKSIELVDVGTSGGVHGLEQGFSMMVGGSKEAYQTIEPLINSLAQTDGYGHVGPVGSGHFVKMVHNAIEYGIMQAYAEGYQLIKQGPFENIDIAGLANIWQHGSINASFLNGLIADMLARDADLQDVDGYVSESGEARWSLEVAKELGIDMPVVQAAFDVRLSSQDGQTNYATKFLAQLRNEFGGHAVNREKNVD